MAQMTHGQACNAPISTTASHCPQCGHPTRIQQQQTVIQNLVGFVFVMGMIGVAGYFLHALNMLF